MSFHGRHDRLCAMSGSRRSSPTSRLEMRLRLSIGDPPRCSPPNFSQHILNNISDYLHYYSTPNSPNWGQIRLALLVLFRPTPTTPPKKNPVRGSRVGKAAPTSSCDYPQGSHRSRRSSFLEHLFSPKWTHMYLPSHHTPLGASFSSPPPAAAQQAASSEVVRVLPTMSSSGSPKTHRICSVSSLSRSGKFISHIASGNELSMPRRS